MSPKKLPNLVDWHKESRPLNAIDREMDAFVTEYRQTQEAQERREMVEVDRARKAFRGQLRRERWRNHMGWLGLAGVFVSGLIIGIWIGERL